MSEEIPVNSRELTFRHIVLSIITAVRFLLSKWKLLLVVGLIGGIVGIIYAWVQEPKYKAVLSFTTEEDKSASMSSLAGLAAQFGLDLGGTSNVFSGDNILPLIQSNRIVQAALLTSVTINGKKISLLNLYIDDYKMRDDDSKSSPLKAVSYPEGQDPQTFSRLQDSILFEIIENINKTQLKAERPDKRVGIFEITCTSNDENFSKLFVDQLIKEVSDFYTENKTKRSRQTVTILQKTADSLRIAYDAALTGRATIADANINPAFQSPIVGIQKKQTDITVLAAAYGEVVKNLEIAKFNLLKETPLITIIDDPNLPLKKIKQGRLLTGIVSAIIFGALCVVYLFFAGIVKDIRKMQPVVTGDAKVD